MQYRKIGYRGPLKLDDTKKLDFAEMRIIVGKKFRSEVVYCSCDVRQVILNGGIHGNPDSVNIAVPNSNTASNNINTDRLCNYKMQVNVDENTNVYNYASRGLFNFIFNDVSSQSVRAVVCDYGPSIGQQSDSEVQLNFVFEYSLFQSTHFSVIHKDNVS